MPFIAQQIRHSIFYLFDSEQAAMENSRDGGSGFFVFTRTSSGHPVFYAVTNTHVIKDGFSVIRVNTGDGKFGTITPTEWLSHPDGADVSVAIVENYDRNLGFSGLPAEWLLPERLLNFEVVHLGADVYMVGRFVLRAGTNTNEPVARSGILSAFPDRANTIKLNGVEKPQEAFLMEMRSLSGFSGSPTFYNLSVREFIGHLKIAMDVVYNVQVPGNTRYAERPELGVYILGIDAGAFSMYEDVIQQDGTVQYQTTYKA